MVRRIKPVSRIRKAETEVRRPKGVIPVRREELPSLGTLSLPAVDIYERPGELVVEMELPGVQEADVKILLYASRLEIIGLKREAAVEAGARYLRLEREFGAFQRDVFVPCAVDPDRTFASLENGILTIVLKKPPRRSRGVDVAGSKG